MNPIIAAAAGLLLGGGAGCILFFRVLTGKAKSMIREAELRGEAIKEKKKYFLCLNQYHLILKIFRHHMLVLHKLY